MLGCWFSQQLSIFGCWKGRLNIEHGFSNVCQIKDYRKHFRNIGYLTWLKTYDLYAIRQIDDTLFYFSKTVPINFCIFGSEFHWDCILSERRTRKWRIPYCCTNFLGLNLKSWAYIAFHNLYYIDYIKDSNTRLGWV